MRNDARPIGEHSPASPFGGNEPPMKGDQSKTRPPADDGPEWTGSPGSIVNCDPADEDRPSREPAKDRP